MCHAKDVILIRSDDDGGWNVSRFNWDEKTGQLEYYNYSTNYDYKSIGDSGDRFWGHLRATMNDPYRRPSNQGEVHPLLEMEGYEVPVLVAISNWTRNRDEDSRTLPERFRGSIEDSIYSDDVSFKMAEFGVLPDLWDAEGLAARYVKTEIFRRSKASGSSLFSSCRPSTYQLA